MAEWLNATVLKTVIPGNRDRGFESDPLHHLTFPLPEENPMNLTCIFCRIISKEIPSKIIAENDSVIVIQDRSPRAPVHYLILPKKHVACLVDLQPEDMQLSWQMIAMAKELAAKLPKPQAFNLIVNNGAEAGQSVFHLHYHFLAQRDIYAGGISL